MIVLLVLLGTSVFGAPTDEFALFSKDEISDSIQSHDQFTRNIVPGISSNQKLRLHPGGDTILPTLLQLDKNNKHMETFKHYVEKGTTFKGLTFNIYDDDMREAAIALFRIFELTDGEDFTTIKSWAKQNINPDMYMYALRLKSLYDDKISSSKEPLLPPFVWNPNYFVNSETIVKALMVMGNVLSIEKIDPQVFQVHQYDYYVQENNEIVNINTNYSGWNLPMNGIEDEINYFREDVGLNSYYLGLHLLHPFWMSNEELNEKNPKHAEHYYYAHQQLMARYLLEKEHLNKNFSGPGKDETDYAPNLMYKNGLPFPTRSCIRRNWDEEQAILKTIDIAIKECISRGILIMQNGTTVSMTEDNHIDVLARLIRANLDSVKTAKIVRSVFGYGGTKVPINEYNPAPSLLHHPETSLRDPVYWHLIQYMLNYFNAYKENMQPYDLQLHENNDINITDANFSQIMTYFAYYQFTINHATTYKIREVSHWPVFITAKQRRLRHAPFTLNFTVESNIETDVIVRLYLGPLCGDNCWEQYTQFFELDSFVYEMREGIKNIVSWSPDTSEKLSSDGYYDTVDLKRSAYIPYPMYNFPKNLVIPKGRENGLSLTLFVMITTADEETERYPSSYYGTFVSEIDSKPLGFPFHRKAMGTNDFASNYRFFNVTILHSKLPVDYRGTFSPHLY